MPEPKIIDVYLCRLRQKLAQASGGQSFILTRRGHGYLLVDPDRQAIPLAAAQNVPRSAA